MNVKMKKIQIFLFAAISILAVASCTRDELVDSSVAAPKGEPTVLTLSFDKSRTSLVDGKTTWLAGDKIRIYSSTGKFYEDVTVPSEDDNKASVEVEVNMKDTLFFAVYPVESANGINAGKVGFKIPANPDGRFASANISAAKSKANTLEMRNVAAILKINVASNNVVEVLQFNSKNAMNGTFTADLDGETPVVEAGTTAKSATVALGAIDGDYYVPIAPGTYDEEFSVTALKGNGGYQTLTSTRKNEVAVNSLLNMGTIGDDLTAGLSGEGTEANPYIVSNIGEYGAFASSVNLGNTYEDKFISLTDNVEGAKATIGYYQDADIKFPFLGTFLGNGKTVTLELDGAATKTPSYVAMFGYVGAGAVLKDINVAGTVTTEGNYAAGLAGYIYGTADDPVSVEHCSSSAAVTGAAAISGIAGYATQTTFSNCTNSGKLEGDYNIGGICGYAYSGVLIKNSRNEGAITSKKDCGRVFICPAGSRNMTYLDGSSSVSYNTISTLGVGGIVGWAQNVTVDTCTNVADIEGVSKLGGIAGVLYWSTTKGCVNSGNITGTQDFIGGITGWTYTQSTCNGDTNSGAIKGRSCVGGIAGMINGGISNGVVEIRNSRNTGKVEADMTSFQVVLYKYGWASLSAAGGIVGFACDHYNGTGNRCAQLSKNVNEGEVYGKGQAVGGIMGMHACPLNNDRNAYLENCVNKGNVSCSLYRAGGIVGVSFNRFTSSVFAIRNNANHGTVTAPYVVAGIVSFATTAYPTGSETPSTYGEQVLNNYNDGKIVYDPTAYEDGKGPYAGGIVGYCQQTWIANNVNYGEIAVSKGSANEYDKKFLAEVVPFLGKASILDYYFAKKTANELGPTTQGSPVPKIGEISGVIGENGEFDVAVVIGENTYEKPVDALNSWIGSSTVYSKWAEGSNKFPVFAE